jgi:hypothetical protein
MLESVSIALLFEQLQPRLRLLEDRRRGLRNTIVGGVALALLGVGACVTAADPPSTLSQHAAWRYGPLVLSLLALGCFGVGFARFLVPGVTGYVNYRARFKKQVVEEVVRAVQPTARYFPDRHLRREVFDQSRLFRTRLDTFRGDDLLQGAAGETPFECSELEATYTTGSGKSRKTHDVFKGLFFRIDLDRELAGHTLVQPRSAAGGDREGMQPVEIDDSFHEVFVVLSTRPDEARSLLGPELRASLRGLAEQAGAPLHLAFGGRVAQVAIAYGRRLFEPRLAGSLNVADLQAMAAPLSVADDVVRALGLERGRRRPPDPAFHAQGFAVGGMEAIADRIASKGDVGIDDLAEAAGTQARTLVDTVAAAQPLERPARTFASATDTGAGLEVRYPIAAGTVIAVLIWIALTPFVLAGLGTLVSPQLGEELRLFVSERAPGVREPAELLLEYPTALLLVSLFLWWLFAASLRNRPLLVKIGHDGVSIRRLFRPMPFVLPLSAVRRIDANDRSLCLVRTDRTMLRGGFVMLSPNLRSDMEARWLQARISQGLRRCGWSVERT